MPGSRLVIHGTWDSAVLAGGMTGATAAASALLLGGGVLIVYGFALVAGLARRPPSADLASA